MEFSVLPADGVVIPAFSGAVDGWPETQHRASAVVSTARLETGASVADHAEAEPVILSLDGWASGLTIGVEVPSSLDVVTELSQPAKRNSENPLVRSAIAAVRNRVATTAGGREVVALVDDVRAETELASPNSARLALGFRNLKSALHRLPPSQFPTGPLSIGVEQLESVLVESPGEVAAAPLASPTAPPVPTLSGGERHTLRGVWGVIQKLLSEAMPVEIRTEITHYAEMVLTHASLTQDRARFRLRFIEIRRASIGAEQVTVPPVMGPAIGMGPALQVGRPGVLPVPE